MATTRPETAAEARERFFARYAPQVGSTWGDVQRYLGLRTPEPTTVEGWVVIAEAIIAKAAQPTPAPAALRFSFEVRAKVGDVEGPLTISGDRLQDVLKAVVQSLDRDQRQTVLLQGLRRQGGLARLGCVATTAGARWAPRP